MTESTAFTPAELTPFTKRRFVPATVELTHRQEVEKLYNALLEREISSSQGLEEWVLDRSELEAAVDQTGSVLYIHMTCHTDMEEHVKAYKNFIENVVPAIKPLDDRLNRKFLKELDRYPLDPDRYDVYVRAVRTDIELFVPQNVELQTKEQLLSQEYQSVCGAMTVTFDGEEKTLPQMGKYLLETDRELRQRAWTAVAQRRLQDKDRLDEIFDNMLKLRNQIAQNAKCENYTGYKFKSLHRFDYTPDDCKQYHQTVEEVVLPLWNAILNTRKERMGLDSLRPWDTAVDDLNRPPLKPFETASELIRGCESIFHKLDPQLGEQFADMASRNLLDLESRKGKAPGGYHSSLDEARKPFIFMNAVGVDSDVRTLLHEAGHAFHGLACARDPLVDYRHGPMEFNEVASMGMELLADKYLSVFYGPDEEKRSRMTHLKDSVYTLVWVATIDAFQHWIYEHPGHTAKERIRAWLDIRRRFASEHVNWEGLEEEHSYLWHRQLHIFQVPFYYIEYGIAQLGALQLWRNAKLDPNEALSRYRHALSLGGSRPLPELFQAAGIRFDFSRSTVKPLMDEIKNELELGPCEAS